MEYLVIGGWAAIAHGLPRTTLDVDLWIRPTEANARRLIDALSEVGFGIAKELTPREILSRQAFLFADRIRIDIFTRPRGLDDFELAQGRRLVREFEGTRIPFLSLDDLIATKKTGRPQDVADLQSLEALRRDRPPSQPFRPPPDA